MFFMSTDEFTVHILGTVLHTSDANDTPPLVAPPLAFCMGRGVFFYSLVALSLAFCVWRVLFFILLIILLVSLPLGVLRQSGFIYYL